MPKPKGSLGGWVGPRVNDRVACYVGASPAVAFCSAERFIGVICGPVCGIFTLDCENE